MPYITSIVSLLFKALSHPTVQAAAGEAVKAAARSVVLHGISALRKDAGKRHFSVR
jgi:hypothetical protein